jgi:exopolysaccharide biosynthesis polyprenyl glycosylphosphotransferase
MNASVATTKEAPSADPATAPAERERTSLPLPGDIRRGRPYLLSATPLRHLVFRLVSVVSLLALDLVAVGFGLYGALALREIYYGHTPILWGVLWDAEGKWFPFIALVTVLVFWQAKLYAERERRAGFGRIVSSLAIVALLVLAFGLGTGHDFSTFGLIPTAFVLTAILDGVLRASYETISREALHALGVRRRAIVVGEGEHLDRLLCTLGSVRGGIEYEFVGVVSSSEPDDDLELPFLGRVEGLRPVLAAHPADELIVTDSDYSERELLQIVEHAHRSGVKVRVAPKTTELLIQRGEYVPGQGVPLFELRPPVFAGTDWAVKRAFDLVVSGFLVVAGLPFWLAIAAAIKLTSRGPVFYRDPRSGLGERVFQLFKFRTMYVDAPEQQTDLERRNEADGALFKIRDDPRVTRVGALLRRLSLDELPNVLNVLRGEMSLVGPRPLPLRDYALLEDWHRRRSHVLPGMTGLWQISGRSDLSFDDLVRLDFYYLENWSIWLDITILAKTLPAVLVSRGAY